jgi:hypothetical protein
MESMRSKTSGAGLGWREAQRLPSLKLWQRQAGAWGRQRSPQKAKKRLNRCQSSRVGGVRRAVNPRLAA